MGSITIESTTGVAAAARIRLLLLVLCAAVLLPWPESVLNREGQQQSCGRFANAQGNSIDPKDFTAAPAEDLDTLQVGSLILHTE
jgi:hypothetical protein